MFAHWERYPPVHVTAALFAGLKPKSASIELGKAVTAATAEWISQMPVLPAPRAGAAERMRARTEGRL